MFDTKIVMILRDDLKPWQELNIAAFLMSGIIAQNPRLIGEPYRDRDGNMYNPMTIQPGIVLSADAPTLSTIQRRCIDNEIVASAYVEDMFSTGFDAANRDVFAKYAPEDGKLVGIGFRAPKKTADKISRGAKMHA